MENQLKPPRKVESKPLKRDVKPSSYDVVGDMPLPMKAYAYLDHAVMALKPSGGWIHNYDFEHASKTGDPVEKVKVRVEEKLRKFGLSFKVSFGRVVQSIGPNWHQVVLDVFVSKK
ncbi:MAG TPA: hypothetical protein VJ249_09950 [Candidatus Bathyarchaeia archaeon]|nr:hypothetical protein [Candidatus Bathyarchaeia archaeon]